MSIREVIESYHNLSGTETRNSKLKTKFGQANLSARRLVSRNLLPRGNNT
jgi:hypothetical protein